MDRSQTSFERDPLAPLRASVAPLLLADVKAASALPKTRSQYFRIGVVVGILSAAAIALIGRSSKNDSSTFPGLSKSVAHQVPTVRLVSSHAIKSSLSNSVAQQVGHESVSVLHDTPTNNILSAEYHAKKKIAREGYPQQTTSQSSHDAPTVAAVVDSSNVRYIPHVLAKQSRDIVYGSLQFGTIMGALNTGGGGVAVTAAHDWMQATLRYTSTFGVASKDVFSQPINKTGNQDVREYALMLGARLEQNDFWASIEAGPNIIHATFNTFVTYPQTDTLSNIIGGGLGASAEATFGYKFSDHVAVDLTGFVSNHSITYGGVLLSVAVGAF